MFKKAIIWCLVDNPYLPTGIGEGDEKPCPGEVADQDEVPLLVLLWGAIGLVPCGLLPGEGDQVLEEGAGDKGGAASAPGEAAGFPRGDGLHSKRASPCTDWQLELALLQMASGHTPGMHGFTGWPLSRAVHSPV